MDLSPFKLDIDELIDEFVKEESTTLAEMKKVWLARKFSYIYEARPFNLAFFMQSLYAHTIGYMVGAETLSGRLGGLYCLYCLHETQPFKPPFKIYLSFGELKKLKNLVVDAKENGIDVVPILVKRMLERNMFLFGAVDLNEGCVAERLNQLTDLQNSRVQIAYKKLFTNTRIENLLHMDLDTVIDLKILKKMSTEYAEAKNLAIREASKVVDVENVKHISGDSESIGDVVEKITKDWSAQKEVFYQQTGMNHQPSLQLQPDEQEHQENDEFDQELEQLLSQT